MKMGDHMQPVAELVNNLTDGDPEKAIKLLSMVIAEYIINQDVAEAEVSTGLITITTKIEVQQ